MSEYTSLEKIRLEKIDELVDEGIEPFPTRAERTHTSLQAIAAFEAAEKSAPEGQPPVEVKVTLAGRIRATRPDGQDHLCSYRRRRRAHPVILPDE